MEYPVWFLPSVTGGTWMALIAVTHVFTSHFAVGGGLYLVTAEMLAYRRQDSGILEFTRRHARFFLLATLVYGSLTGVGIWFVISLIQPAGTSLLIHNYVFAWAAEWVFFLVEIVAASIYVYTFGKMRPSSHLAIGWIYFASAWGSLFLINGIITFMLSPGEWTVTGSFWDGFFNPTFWPSLLFRTLLALLLAGVWAFLTTAFLRDRELKARMTRFSSWWTVIPLAAAVPAGYWYLAHLPEPARKILREPWPQLKTVLQIGLGATAAVLLCTLFFCLLRPRWHSRPVALAVFVGGLGLMMGFEWGREAARRPYVIRQALYTTGIAPTRTERINAQGFLASARWSRLKEAAGDHRLQAGEELFRFQCYACHSLHGWNNDLAVRTTQMSYPALTSYIGRLHEVRSFMPPFAGTREEAAALAAWLAGEVHGKELPPPGAEDEWAGGAGTGGASGRQVFESYCSMCHQLQEGYNPLAPKIEGWDRERIRSALDRLSELNPAMPPLQAPPAEKEALADFLYRLSQGGRP